MKTSVNQIHREFDFFSFKVRDLLVAGKELQLSWFV